MVYARMTSARDASLISKLTSCWQSRLVVGMKKCVVAASKILRHKVHDVKLIVFIERCSSWSALVMLLLVQPCALQYGSVHSDSNPSGVHERWNFDFTGRNKFSAKKKKPKKNSPDRTHLPAAPSRASQSQYCRTLWRWAIISGSTNMSKIAPVRSCPWPRRIVALRSRRLDAVSDRKSWKVSLLRGRRRILSLYSSSIASKTWNKQLPSPSLSTILANSSRVRVTV